MDTSTNPHSLANIDYFNTVVGLIFEQLYRNFPAPIDINAGNFTPTFLTNSNKFDIRDKKLAYDGLENELELAASVIAWLIEEGYLRSSDSGNILFLQCVLSSKGLQTLSFIPSPSESTESIGEKMVNAAESGMMDGIKDLARTVVCEGGKFVFQSTLDAFAKALVRP